MIRRKVGLEATSEARLDGCIKRACSAILGGSVGGAGEITLVGASRGLGLATIYF